MKVSKEISEKVKKYQELKEESERLLEDIRKYFVEELGAEGFVEPFISEKPTGDLQCEDEFCDQYQVYEDCFKGNYYHKIEGSNKYVGYTFYI